MNEFFNNSSRFEHLKLAPLTVIISLKQSQQLKKHSKYGIFLLVISAIKPSIIPVAQALMDKRLTRIRFHPKLQNAIFTQHLHMFQTVPSLKELAQTSQTIFQQVRFCVAKTFVQGTFMLQVPTIVIL